MSLTGRQKIDPSRINKVLIIRLRRIGDIIMTTPAISALRKGFPDAFISYLVEEPYRELVEGNPDLDNVIVIEKDQSKKSLLKLISKVRKEKYDAVLDFHGGPRASFIAWLSKARLKVGYKIKYRNFIYHIKVPRKPQPERIHSVENHLNFVKALGIDINPPPPLYLPSPQKNEVEKIEKFLENNGLEGYKTVVIHISAGNEFRDWGKDNWTKLINLLSKNPVVKIVLIGADEDRMAGKKILKETKGTIHSLVGKLNLREVRELISQSSLFVGSDSGPMHIAASTSTPIIALFGPTLPANFAPWEAIATLIEKKLDCRPCKQRQCMHEDFRCLRSITPEEVYQACLRFI